MIISKIKSLLSYDPLTGIFLYKKDAINKAFSKGDIAGFKVYSREKYYLCIRVEGELYRLHHLAFVFMEDRLPKELVDHKDGNTINNIWSNLRCANRNQNAHNYKKPITNTSGVKGLYERTDGWQIRVMLSNKAKTMFFANKKYGSSEKAKEVAIKALQNLRDTLHKEFANHG